MARTKQKPKARAANADSIRIGIIGGSGLYSMAGVSGSREVRLKTPFGDPSDALLVGTVDGKRVAFLARHARGHRFLPTEINYRANIHAMKQLGVERIISVSAVGSLQEELKPLDFLIPDQFYGRTWALTSRFARCWPEFSAQRAIRRRCACTAAARTFAWRGRNFPRWPNRM